GMQAAKQSCQAVAAIAGVNAESVLPFSTGVIGQQLPVEKIEAALPAAFSGLQADNWFAAAHAIMTTDTIAKARSVQCQLNGQTVTLTGIAKGSGMIRPDMATMLSYIATDAVISQSLLDQLLRQSMEQSFNRITVDGDTSTNDACVLIATGKAGNAEIDSLDSAEAQIFLQALNDLSRFLAQAIVRDGEGATKFVSIAVKGGADTTECRQVAYTIAHSPLVKTALFASDPNWGRILAAVGRSGLDNLDLTKIHIALNEVTIVAGGQPANDYTEDRGQQVMDQSEITIHVELGRGDAQDFVWTCDFSYDYVKINAEYRT
ncbi:MAG: bifunctional glutamate N-acetyltransferase/amino-acid acetyltransferase ArgJ, partial [Methylophaga sp.]